MPENFFGEDVAERYDEYHGGAYVVAYVEDASARTRPLRRLPRPGELRAAHDSRDRGLR
jgi:hypothetical protein